MIGLVVTGHANFGSGMTSSVNLIAGEQEAYQYVDFLPTYSTEDLAAELIRFMNSAYKGVLEEKYQIEGAEDPYQLLEGIARSRNCLLKGQELDTGKAALLLLDDFRNGKLGRLTLEYPPEV